MLVHRKQSTKLDKPARFNLGGLLKRKISWRRSIDASIGDSTPENAGYFDSSHHNHTPLIQLPEAQPKSVPEPTRESEISFYNVDFRESPSLAPHYSLTAANGHYTHLSPVHDSAITECISLQNSEMTHNDEEIDPLCQCDDLRLPQAPHEDSPSFDLKNEESIAEYKAGGYCAIKIGDQFSSSLCRYKVLRKLGWGHFSTVWLALSSKNEYVALKVVKSGKNYSDAAVDEIKILKYLQADQDASVNGANPCTDKFVALLDTFDITTPSGTHVAMVFELMGENILHLIYKQKLERCSLKVLQQPLPPAVVPLDMVKSIISQLLRSMDHMHRKGIIHTDIKPENVLMTYEKSIPEALRVVHPTPSFRILPSKPLASTLDDICSSPLRVRVADLGNATYASDHITDHIQTRQYRAPEILLKHDSWGASADVWSIGCLIFELITGDFLFDSHDGASFTKDEDHLAQIIELLGEFPSPKYLSECQKASEFFDSPTSLRNIHSLKFWSLEDVLVEKYKFHRGDVNVLLVSDLIRKCLRYDLNERYDCASLINHPWFSPNPSYDAAALDALPNRNYEIPGFTREE